MKLIIISLLIIFNNCKIFEAKEKSGISTSPTKGKIFLLGNLEPRDYRIHRGIIKNFRDMLCFELSTNGYICKDLRETKDPQKKEPKSEKEISQNLIPESFQIKTIEEKEDRGILNEEEIKKLREEVEFDYFVQGGISTTEFGTILEPEIGSSVYIKIFTKKGELIHQLYFHRKDKSFQNPDLIRESAETLLEKIKKI